MKGNLIMPKLFSKQIKAKAIDKVKGGISVKDVSKIIGTTPASVRAWMRNANNDNHVKPEKSLPKLNALEKENKSLLEENAVLLKIINRLS